MESKSRRKIVDVLTDRESGKVAEAPTYLELQALVVRYEELLTFLANAAPPVRNRLLKPWESQSTKKVGRPRTRGSDENLVELIGHLRENGKNSDAEAIREFIDIHDARLQISGQPPMVREKKKQVEKTLKNRLIDARNRAAASRK
jgi:hypothetical protein